MYDFGVVVFSFDTFVEFTWVYANSQLRNYSIVFCCLPRYDTVHPFYGFFHRDYYTEFYQLVKFILKHSMQVHRHCSRCVNNWFCLRV